jgi:hypothetical protein
MKLAHFACQRGRPGIFGLITPHFRVSHILFIILFIYQCNWFDFHRGYIKRRIPVRIYASI